MPPKTDAGIEVRDYAPGDENAILEAYRRSFGTELGGPGADPEALWRWFYIENPARKVYVKLAKSSGRIASHYAVTPVWMKIESWRGLGTLSLHTMTDPDFRGRGLFTRLATDLYADLTRDGIPVTYGFPNSESVHGFVAKLGWIEPCPPPVSVFPLEPKKVLAAQGRHPLVAGIAGTIARGVFRSPRTPEPRPGRVTQPVKEFGPEFDTLWARASGNLRVSAVRDAAFLNWRFAHKPGETYTTLALRSGGRLDGYAVMKRGSIGSLSVGFLMDLLVAPPAEENALMLLATAVRAFRDECADAITCMLPAWHPAAAALRRLRFVWLKPTQFPEEMHFGCRIHLGGVPWTQLRDPGSWYVTWADSDVV